MTVATPVEEIRTYHIPEQNFEGLTAKLAKLNRKAKRLNKPSIVLNNIGTEDKTLEDGRTVQRYLLVQIVGEAPCVEGYQFVATLQFVSEVGTLIRAVPGQHIPETYRTAENWCDHCRQNRRRNENFIVRHVETGEYRQVGRNCLADFLGGVDPHQVADYAELLADLADECEATEQLRGGGGSRFFLLETYLSFVAKCVAEHGWVSRAKAREASENGDTRKSATADSALNDMFPHPKYKPTQPTAEHTETAKAALVWVEENIHNKADLNDYEHNLKVCTSSTVIDRRMAGIAGSLIAVYRRATTATAATQNAPKVVSVHIGTVKGHIQQVVTVQAVVPCESDFGTSYLHLMVTADGNVITTFNKSELADKGDTIEIKAKVKAHDDYKGTKQTVVFYTKVLRTIEAEG